MLVDTDDLGDRRGHRPSEISGGEQQRVAVARALITRPGRVRRRAHRQPGLGRRARRSLTCSVERSTSFGQTIVMVTHDPTSRGRSPTGSCSSLTVASSTDAGRLTVDADPRPPEVAADDGGRAPRPGARGSSAPPSRQSPCSSASRWWRARTSRPTGSSTRSRTSRADAVEGIDVIVTPKEEFTAQMAAEQPTIDEARRGSRWRASGGVEGGARADHCQRLAWSSTAKWSRRWGRRASSSSPHRIAAGIRSPAPRRRRPRRSPGEVNGPRSRTPRQRERRASATEVGLATRRGVQPVEVVGVVEVRRGCSSLGGATSMVDASWLDRSRSWYDSRARSCAIAAIAVEAGVDPAALAGTDTRGDAGSPEGTDRASRTRRSRPTRSTIRSASFLTPGAAGARRRRGPGRRVHHLQHLLDHRGPAHARVRHAALARGHARPGRSAVVAGEALLIGDARLARWGSQPASPSRRLLNSPVRRARVRHPAQRRSSSPRARSRSRWPSGSGSRSSPRCRRRIRATRIPPVAAMAGARAEARRRGARRAHDRR